MELNGNLCGCELDENSVKIFGKYYLYSKGERKSCLCERSLKISEIMRIGMAKTYSKRALLLPSAFGILALVIKNFPKIEIQKEIVPVFFSVGHTFWELPYQETLWKVFAALFFLGLLIYRMSYRTDLEINTFSGRFLLPTKGMDNGEILLFQKKFYELKNN